ncbi:MAG: aminotransferase class I/II-fold pyridoxal phosphate-dependent enzyme [Bacteroidetes bacterium]|nr:MAG: aminotransferase class I/II-fold pyridoxal phosphate-dependent enzyme [Bacteroidota bacterium]
MLNLHSKLPNTGTSIFSVMTALANEHGAINLSQGFPDFDCDQVLKSLVTKYMRKGLNQYAPMPGVRELREVIATKMQKSYGLELDPDTEITITAGATEALFSAITALVRPDDEVILIEPAYDSYRPAVEVNGGIAVTYELKAPDYKVDWKLLERLISWRTRLIVVNTPHNPTGKVFRQADWQQLQKIAEDRDILVLSDEAYEHLTFDGLAHQSMLRFPEVYKRGLAVFSFGKTIHATGWKMGCCIAPPQLSREFRKVHQYNVFSVNTPMQYALADFFADEENYIHLPAFFQEKRDFFLRQMEGVPLKPLKSEGTYFQLFDYSAFSDMPDLEFAKWLTTEVGVAAIPVSAFYASGRDEKVVRFCFAKQEQTLKKAAEKLMKLGDL